MKKALVLLLSIIHYSIACSQNAGIGTNSPSARLHVADTGLGKYSFDGLTISGYDGSGANLNCRTNV